MTNSDFDAASDYRNQFAFGTAEEKAVTGLLNLLTENDTFAYARQWRIHRAATRSASAQQPSEGTP